MLVTHLDTYSRLGIPKLHHLVAFEAEDEVEEGKQLCKITKQIWAAVMGHG